MTPLAESTVALCDVSLDAWYRDLHVRRDGESAGEHIVRVVRALDGVSLVHDRARLERLFRANEPAERAALVASMRTNCGTSARAIYALVGVEADARFILRDYEVGMAIAWLLEQARLCNALEHAREWHRADAGWLMWYGTPGHNDDHVEWCLEPVDPRTGYAAHGGGGRPNNAITVCAPSDIRWSAGRPLRALIDPERVATNPARGDNPY